MVVSNARQKVGFGSCASEDDDDQSMLDVAARVIDSRASHLVTIHSARGLAAMTER